MPGTLLDSISGEGAFETVPDAPVPTLAAPADGLRRKRRRIRGRPRRRSPHRRWLTVRSWRNRELLGTTRRHCERRGRASMARAFATGLLAIVLAGCGSSATPAPSSGSTSAPASGGPSDRPTPLTSTSAPTSPEPTSTPEPTATALTLLGAAPTSPLDAGTAARLQAVVDGAVEHGAPDMIAAVITADGTWAGAAGIDGPKGRKARADRRVRDRQRQQGAPGGAGPQARGPGEDRARRTD